MTQSDVHGHTLWKFTSGCCVEKGGDGEGDESGSKLVEWPLLGSVNEKEVL